MAEARTGRERHAAEMRDLLLAIQRLEQQAAADATTRVTTAAALKDAEEARRDKTEQSWSPLTRVLAVVGSLATLAGLGIAWYVATR